MHQPHARPRIEFVRLFRMFLDPAVLRKAVEAVNEELSTHIGCLQEPLLLPEDRDHIKRNLVAGCARGMLVIAPAISRPATRSTGG